MTKYPGYSTKQLGDFPSSQTGANTLPFSFASPPNRTQKTDSVLEDFTLYLYAFCISSECTFPVLFS